MLAAVYAYTASSHEAALRRTPRSRRGSAGSRSMPRLRFWSWLS